MEFYILDVFAENKFEGNQLAVFRVNKDNISESEMQQIAKEINFQESTFIFNEEEENKTCKVRIFTPELEMKFAGHPTIGTAWVLNNLIFSKSYDEVFLDLNIGKIKVENIENELWFTSTQPSFSTIYTADDIEYFTNLKVDDFDIDIPIQEVSTGSPYIIVTLKSEDSLREININIDLFRKWLNNKYKNNNFIGLYFWVKIDNTNLKSRMIFIENNALKEDAATGSACSCLLAYMLKYINTNIKYINYQGEYINRPSIIKMNGQIDDNQYIIKIGGKSQFIAKGHWE